MTILSKVTLANANSAQTVLYNYTKYPHVKYLDYVAVVFFYNEP
jgi:hypothetical protein